MSTVSIVVPVYNERAYIAKILNQLDELVFRGNAKEIIVVNDCSTDGTTEILNQFVDRFKIYNHKTNCGKGEALKTGFAKCRGDIIAVQDADLEYNPADLIESVALLNSTEARVVYGSRMMAHNPVGHWAYYFGNRLISFLTRWLYAAKITDVETGHKVFRREVLELMKLENNDFGFEVEFTAKLLKQGIKIMERPISYQPRQFNEGKKIGWRDGLKAVWLLIKYRFKD
ncbi:MAG: glycosyltransferase family 2 protein [Patescibacteria group bacterium]|nr:glycosyltransferase family 2 protein [Patescibacteria group bacterium]